MRQCQLLDYDEEEEETEDKETNDVSSCDISANHRPLTVTHSGRTKKVSCF
jgi:hypothetical protein